jgi:hypothetical protein
MTKGYGKKYLTSSKITTEIESLDARSINNIKQLFLAKKEKPEDLRELTCNSKCYIN